MTEPLQTHVESTDGVTVVAHDHGGDGPPVIFCHATGMHGRYWDPVCRHLSDDFRCIAFDLRGHGDSTIPPGLEMNWKGMGEDVLALVDFLGLAPVLAVGHSMGGCSIVMAEQFRPGTIERGWLFEPIVVPPNRDEFFPSPDNQMVIAAKKRREVFESREAAMERYASRPPYSMVDPEALRAYVYHGFTDQPDGTVILKCRRDVEADVFAHSQTNVFDGLGQVKTPLVIAGSGDGEGPANIASIVAEGLPNGRFEGYPDLTHFAPMEAPARVADAIRAALLVS